MRLLKAAVLFLAVPGFAGDAPDWISGPSLEYPREKFVTGVGMGDDMSAAQDRARSEISRVFSTFISVTTSISESEANARQDGKTLSSAEQSAKQAISTNSSRLLEGVEIVETWQNPATRQFYALAVLDRAKAVSAVTDKISGLETQIKSWTAEFNKATAKYPRIKAAVKVLSLLNKRDTLNSELRIISSDSKGADIPDGYADRTPFSKAIAELNIFVDADGQNPSQVETGIITSLSAMNLSAMTASSGAKPDGADIVVYVKTEVGPERQTSKDADWKWASSSATASLKEGATGKVFLQFYASDRQASADYNEAVKRTLGSLARKVAQAVQGGITSYFENQ